MHAFIHIPKTAGTTVKRQLLKAPGLSVLNIKNQAALGAQYRQDIPAFHEACARHDVMVGHLFYMKWWAQKVDAIISVVRDPIRRAISQVNFIRATPAHEQHAMLREKGFKTAFATDEYFFQNLRDIQFRCLFGEAAYTDLNGRIPTEDMFNTLFAKHRYLVGCIEKFPDFCTRLQDRLGLTADPDIHEKVRSKGDDYVFDDDDIASIRACNPIDRALFNFVLSRGVADTTHLA